MKPFTLRLTIGAPTHLPLSKREVSSQIEMLIDLLDKMEGDPDLEETGDDEPSLGWSRSYAFGRDDDLEKGRI